MGFKTLTGSIEKAPQEIRQERQPATGSIVDLFENGIGYRIYLPHQDTDYIQGRIATEKHPYELLMLQDMASRLEPGDHVIDVGANVGNHTLYLAAAVGCRVSAYEPNPDLCEAIRKSAQLNGLEGSIEVHEAGVGAAHGQGNFLSNNAANLGAQKIEVAENGSGAFNIIALDDQAFTGHVRGVKIDVEGMELSVLEGAKNLLQSQHPIIYIEGQTEAQFVAIYEFLSRYGYNYWETFNATPTHLFLHTSQVTDVQRADRMLYKLVRQDYRSVLQLAELRQKLEDANHKYRGANEQIAALKQKVDTTNKKHRLSSEQNDALKQKLTDQEASFQEERRRLIAHHEASLGAAQTKITDLEQALTEANLKYRATKERLDNANDKYRLATEQSSALKQQLTEQIAEHQEEKLRLLGQQQALDQTLASTRERIAELEKRIVQQSAELLISTEKETLAQAQCHDLKENLRCANLESRSANDRIISLNKKLDDAFDKYRMSCDLLNISKQLHTTEKTELYAEVAALKLELRAKNADIQHHQARAAALSSEDQQGDRSKSKQLEQALAKISEQRDRLIQQQTLERASLNKLERQLADANRKYREATGQHIPLLKEKYTAANTQSDSQKRELLGLTRQIKDLKLQKKRLEHRVAALRSSISFQLGFALVSAVSSWKGFVRLPIALWRISGQGLRYLFNTPRPNSQATLGLTTTVSNQVNGATAGLQHPPQSDRPSATNTQQPDTPSPPNLAHGGSLKSLRTACIMDEFTFGSFQPECVLQQLTPTNWQAELEAFQPELLFIESAWRGKDELWGSKVGHKSIEVQGIVAWCRERAIPTVFWNKEDPVHFQTFLNTAKLFDYVFTTDLDCIHRYKAALGHERIYLLPFAAQPALHNPIERYPRKDAISFAGAYYARYPERTRDLESFLKALPTFRPVEIYDRNFGKNHPDYQFPSEYQPFIVGTLPFDKIDLAYKGYQYAINLNSIKQSQTMFARRVFELLASNTITISNFSRGLRLLLGGLVITSDSGDQIVQRLESIAEDPETAGKLKLAALRKIMLEHTYERRLSYLCAKLGLAEQSADSLPAITVMARVKDQAEAERVLVQCLAQTHPPKRLVLVTPGGVQLSDDLPVVYLTESQAADRLLGDVAADTPWIASLWADDYYGPNYLTDALIASRYSGAGLIGKSAHFQAEADAIRLASMEDAYKPLQALPVRRAVIKTDLVRAENLLQWLETLATRQLECADGLSIDPYNYCANVQGISLGLVKQRADDLPGLNTGMAIRDLQSLAENIPPAAESGSEDMLSPVQLEELFGGCKSKKIHITLSDTALKIHSGLADGKHEYLYAGKDLEPEILAKNGELRCHLDATPGLAISLVVLFLDVQGHRLGHRIIAANRNGTADIPPETAWLRLGFRILSAGETEIKGLVLNHRDLQPAELLGASEHLLLTNHYPSYEDLYRNGFVHSRVRAYQAHHVSTDIFRLRPNESVSYHEFENIDVTTGSKEALHRLLSSGRYKHVLVHFLSPEMWEVLEEYVDRIKIVVWIHGAEIHPWYRRKFNYESNEQIEIAKLQSEKRLAFWRDILKPMPANLRLVFVSRNFAEEVMEDLEFRLPESQYQIIHNPINTNMFSYREKNPEQRKKILSIRPYASRQYANDLSVKAIRLLADKPFFKELEFRLIGDGKLFEATLAPLKGMENVTIERRFLIQPEIARLHKEYGLFLCPTRWDSQGVSRDEAMASGLVPITNKTAAIPEFVDDGCGVLAPPEEVEQMAAGIEQIFNNPERFEVMSSNAAQRVRAQTSQERIIPQELKLIDAYSEPKSNNEIAK